jgi:hypothetical protein
MGVPDKRVHGLHVKEYKGSLNIFVVGYHLIPYAPNALLAKKDRTSSPNAQDRFPALHSPVQISIKCLASVQQDIVSIHTQ